MHVGTLSQRGVLETVAGKLRYHEQICDHASDWSMHRWFSPVHCRRWETHRSTLCKCARIAAVVKFTTKEGSNRDDDKLFHSKDFAALWEFDALAISLRNYQQTPCPSQRPRCTVAKNALYARLVPQKSATSFRLSQGFAFVPMGQYRGSTVTEHWMQLPTSDDKREPNATRKKKEKGKRHCILLDALVHGLHMMLVWQWTAGAAKPTRKLCCQIFKFSLGYAVRLCSSAAQAQADWSHPLPKWMCPENIPLHCKTMSVRIATVDSH